MIKPMKGDSELLSLLMNAVEIIQIGVMWLNEDGHLYGANQQLRKELGYDKDEFVPKTIFEINPTTSFLSWKKLWKQLLEENEFVTETEQLTADHLIYPVTMRGVLLQLGDQKVCMAVTENLMDFNRYKDLLNLTSQIANIGSWEWDLVQNDLVFSDEMFRLLQIPPKKELTKDVVVPMLAKVLSKTDLEKFYIQIDGAVKKGKAFEQEFSINLNEKHQNFNVIAKPVVLENRTIKIFGTLQNLAKISKRTNDLYFAQYCMDNARDMIFWVNPNGEITYANQTTCEKLGYSFDELLNKNVKDISFESKVDLEVHWQELKEKKSLEFESVHVTKDGKLFPVSIVANYMNYKGKEFNCGFVRDLSGKVKRDEIIAMAKQSLDQAIDMIFWLNPDASFKYFNEAFIKKTGYSSDELKQMTILDFFPDTTQEDFNMAWEKMREGAILENASREMTIKGGKIIDIELTVSLVTNRGKECSTTTMRDISLRKKKEKELQLYLQQIEELQKQTEAQNIELLEEIHLDSSFNNIISKDPNYKRVLRQVEQVADTEATVLILGETGTGKELLARAVHRLSNRASQPMIKVNCGALPENLIESELFGHEKGSFTGAYERKIGKFERANNGTIFLDEIGELPLDLQTKLLRVLQEGEIERIGGNELIQLDVRVIAATNRNLEEQVVKKKFREDLYYRLNVFPIVNIPLRERMEDIPVLVKHFTEKYAKKMNKEIVEISSNSMDRLMAYDFLGNVRELENMVERAVILAKSKTLTFDMVFSRKKSSRDSKFLTMEEAQKEHIIKALKRTNGKVSGKTGAANLLNLNDKTLTSKMAKLGLKRKDYIKA